MSETLASETPAQNPAAAGVQPRLSRSDYVRPFGLASCAGAALIALLGLFGGLAGRRIVDSSLSQQVPMALSTALSFLLLCAVLALCLRGSAMTSGVRRLRVGLVFLVFSVVVLNLAGRLSGAGAGAPDLLFKSLQDWLGVPSISMSPATSALFLCVCLGALPLCRRGELGREPAGLNWTGFLGAFVALWGTVFMLGYVYGTPLLYATGLVPVARSTAAAFALLGAGLVCLAGPELPPLRLFAGPSVKALLLRAFLPVIAALSLLHSLLLGQAGFGIGQGNALLAAGIAVGYAAVTGLVVLLVARRVGAALERAETLRQEAEERLRAALTEKTVLLKEMHHRVKNNMQVVSSLLTLQMEYVADPRDRVLFEESRARIGTMAMVHEELYKSEDLASVDMGRYVTRLVERITGGGAGSAHTKFDIEDLRLSVTQSLPCGLLLNELVLNVLKHAFPHAQSPLLGVTLRGEGGLLVLSVEDNGPGLPPGFDLRATGTLGMVLVDSLAKQLHGSVTVENLSPGARFTVRFPREV